MTLRVFNKIKQSIPLYNYTIRSIAIKDNIHIKYDFDYFDNYHNYIYNIVWTKTSISFTYIKRHWKKPNTTHNITLDYRFIDYILLYDENGCIVQRRTKSY